MQGAEAVQGGVTGLVQGRAQQKPAKSRKGQQFFKGTAAPFVGGGAQIRQQGGGQGGQGQHARDQPNQGGRLDPGQNDARAHGGDDEADGTPQPGVGVIEGPVGGGGQGDDIAQRHHAGPKPRCEKPEDQDHAEGMHQGKAGPQKGGQQGDDQQRALALTQMIHHPAHQRRKDGPAQIGGGQGDADLGGIQPPVGQPDGPERQLHAHRAEQGGIEQRNADGAAGAGH